MKTRSLPYLVMILSVAAVYFGAAKLGLEMAFVAKQVSPVWPPTGIALAAVLILGYSVWPGIMLGALLANATVDESIVTACGIGLGNTLEALAGAWLLQHLVGFRRSLERLRDVLGLVLLAVPLSTMVAATIGVASLCAGGVRPWSDFGLLWPVWWLGDAMGALVMAPALLTWMQPFSVRLASRRLAEAGVLLTSLVGVSLIVFVGQLAEPTTDHPLEYAVFPFVIWAALRFSQRATTAATLVASSIAIWGTVQGLGPFAKESAHESLVLLQLFLGVVAVTGLVVGAVMGERNRMDQRRAANHAVTQVLAESTTLAEAAPRLLQVLCQNLESDLADLWIVDADQLRCVEFWQRPPPRALEFESACRQYRFVRGVGLPGRVWASGQAAWIADVARDTNFQRAPFAVGGRFRSAFAFPILLGDRVYGVIELLSRQVREPDPDLLATFGALGSQIGQFIDRKRVEEKVRESEERLRLALDAGKCGVWDWDIANDVVTWSERIYEFYGMSPGSFGGTVADFSRLIHPADAERVSKAIQQALETGAPYEIEFRVLWPSGEVRWLATSGRVIFDATGKPIRMLGAAQDTTRRKAAEDALHEADRRKDEFLAMLAHELRNPLAPIRNALYILKLPQAHESERAQAQDMMERQLEHLVRLVDDLLDVARIMRGQIELRKEPVDLSTIITRAIETAQPLIDAQVHTLTVSLPQTPIRLEGDLVRLAQVFANLLNNAAKYTETGGRIWLSAEQGNTEVTIRIRDNGVGIAPETLPHIFDLFVQAKRSLARSQGGLGIGLTLVRRVVEMHGGSIFATSAGLGKGSEFAVRLPILAIATNQESPPSPRSKSPINVLPRQILVVDDNQDAAESLALLLRRKKHEVRVAYDGPSALDAARHFRPQVVFLDIDLPHLDGYAVARQLRREPGMEMTLLVAMTGYGQLEDRQHSARAGFDVHLTKPVDFDAVNDLLAQGLPVAR